VSAIGGKGRVLPPRYAVVLRFPPGGDGPAGALRREARSAHRRHAKELGADPTTCEPWYRLSVFVDVAQPGEDEDDVLRRLIQIASNANIRVSDPRNSGFWVAKVGDILDSSFSLTKDLYPGEPQEHYSVDVGPTEPDNDRMQQFMALFDGPRSTQEAAQP